VAPEIAFLVTYPCPRCGVALEARADDWQDWLLCPSCGRAGRPPAQRRLAARDDGDTLYIGTFATGPSHAYGNGNGHGHDPAGMYGPTGSPTAAMPRLPDRGGATARRVIIGGGFFLATVLSLISVAQQNPTPAGVCGFVAFLLLLLLARSSARE